MTKKVGLTMRVVRETKYREERDALAQDWGTFFGANYPDVSWVPVPNLGAATPDFLKRWEIDGVILTGGNDIGDSVLRDESEKAIIKYSIENKLPLLGVCRGAQLLNSYFGGQSLLATGPSHSGVAHKVTTVRGVGDVASNSVLEVNSYHNFVIRREGLAPTFEAFAVGEDETIEGIRQRDTVVGIQWHPERAAKLSLLDRELFRLAFGWVCK